MIVYLFSRWAYDPAEISTPPLSLWPYRNFSKCLNCRAFDVEGHMVPYFFLFCFDFVDCNNSVVDVLFYGLLIIHYWLITKYYYIGPLDIEWSLSCRISYGNSERHDWLIECQLFYSMLIALVKILAIHGDRLLPKTKRSVHIFCLQAT